MDTIVSAAAAVGFDWTTVSVVTYRNNLNKLLLTPLAPDKVRTAVYVGQHKRMCVGWLCRCSGWR